MLNPENPQSSSKVLQAILVKELELAFLPSISAALWFRRLGIVQRAQGQSVYSCLVRTAHAEIIDGQKPEEKTTRMREVATGKSRRQLEIDGGTESLDFLGLSIGCFS